MSEHSPVKDRKRVICAICRRTLHMQRNGAWYHDHNASESCYFGTGSSKRANPIRVEV